MKHILCEFLAWLFICCIAAFMLVGCDNITPEQQSAMVKACNDMGMLADTRGNGVHCYKPGTFGKNY